jgi:2-polyprenyl-3-methyl-5-hydroxy-6-metoxy-1,4-benzoquinol methylase
MVPRYRQSALDPKSAGADAPIHIQRDFWNSWNSIFLGNQRSQISQRQAAVIEGWLESNGRHDLDILDVGCGTGWMSERLQRFGQVAATDLSDDVLAAVRTRLPSIRFVAGDFMSLEFPPASADLIVTLEVLSHIADQPAFLAKLASVLRPGGSLMLATQNRPVLERCEDVAPRAEGQIRNWVDRHQLRALLEPHFSIERMVSICPHGHRGLLRLTNSEKLNATVGAVIGRARLDRLKERLWLGHTLVVWGRRR